MQIDIAIEETPGTRNHNFTKKAVLRWAPSWIWFFFGHTSLSYSKDICVKFGLIYMPIQESFRTKGSTFSKSKMAAATILYLILGYISVVDDRPIVSSNLVRRYRYMYESKLTP